jgi:hypothetical protein
LGALGLVAKIELAKTEYVKGNDLIFHLEPFGEQRSPFFVQKFCEVAEEEF